MCLKARLLGQIFLIIFQRLKLRVARKVGEMLAGMCQFLMIFSARSSKLVAIDTLKKKSYRNKLVTLCFFWWVVGGSNPRPSD